MMHSFPTNTHSIESQAALNHLQPTLIAGNTLKLCDFKMCLSIEGLGCTRCPAEEAVDCRIAAKGSCQPFCHFDQPSRNREAHLQGHPRVPQVEVCTVICWGKRWNFRQACQSASAAMNALCFARLFRIICSFSASVQQKTVLLDEMWWIQQVEDISHCIMSSWRTLSRIQGETSKNREDNQESILNGAKDE